MNKAMIASLLAIFVFIFFIPYPKIGFDSDTFGLMDYCSKIDTKEEFIHSLFRPLRIQLSYEPLNEQKKYENTVYINQYYRPILFLAHFLCYKAFGFNPYAYFLISILLHTVVASLVYLIFSFFLTNLWAILLALIFAMHPVMVPSFIGLTCAILPVYLLLSVSVFLYFYYFFYGNVKYYFLSGLFYFLSLFAYELPIALPAIIIVYFLLFNIKNVVRQSWLFIVLTLVYYFIRSALIGHDINPFAQVTLFSIVKGVLFNWYQAVKPFLGLTQSNNILVVLVVLLFGSLLVFQFIFQPANRKKIFFYISAFLLASWPVSLCYPIGRYFYTAIPFFCLILFDLFVFLSTFIKKGYRKKFVFISLLMVIFWSGYRSVYCLLRRENYTHRRDLAFQELTKKYSSNNNIVYLGVLHAYNDEIFLMQSGMTQATRFFFNNSNMLVYHVIESKFYSKYDTEKMFDIIPVNGGYRFVSSDSDNLFIMSPHLWKEGKKIEFSMGSIIPNKKYSCWQSTDVSFIFDQQWRDQNFLKNTVFLSWDMVNWKFIELDKKHLLIKDDK